MIALLPTLLTFGVILAPIARAVEWHVLEYFVAGDQQITSYSGQMVVPPIPKAATYYLWPGLQPDDDSGVFQPVLDGRSGGWWIGTGWCCSNPSLAWGSGFAVTKGDTVQFSMRRNATSKNWDTVLAVPQKKLKATGSFPLGDKRFNEFVTAIELYDTTWDFGPLAFKNIVVEAQGGVETGWCNANPSNLYDSTNFAISGVKTSVDAKAKKVTCSIASLTMQSPK